MVKILTVVVPCYNSEAYMNKCLKTVISAGEEVEVIIFDDGSTDRTAEIADEYGENYPSIVKIIHKENGGHGDAVNTGLENATGVFFKVVDSDDWVDTDVYAKVVKVLKKAVDNEMDMLLTNFVYDKAGVRRKKVMKYESAFPERKLIGWGDKIKLTKAQYILMHSVIYRTQVLRQCDLKLPKHTFYVDNIFIFKPLPYVRKIYYLNVDLYHYFIGRNDQSVNEKVMISRLEQQMRVNRIMIDIFVEEKDRVNSYLYKYMFQYVDMMMCVSSVMAILSNDKEKLKAKDELWNYLKSKDEQLYHKYRRTIFGITMNLPGRTGRFFSKVGYKVCQKIFGFN